MKTTSYTTALLTLAVVLTGLAASAADFPFNGSFAYEKQGQPEGWSVTGAWRVVTLGSLTHPKAVRAWKTLSHAGDQLTSEGYYFVAPGDNLTLTIDYRSPTGGLVAGVEFCDELGRPLGAALRSNLPASDDWATWTDQFSLTPEICAAGVASARVFLAVAAEETEALIGGVVLSAPDTHCSASLPQLTPGPPPKTDALSRPNLLARTGSGAAGQGSMLPPGSPLPSQGTGTNGVTLTDPSPTQPQQLVICGCLPGTGWSTTPLAVDQSYPYELSAHIVGPPAGMPPLTMMLRSMEPGNGRIVWLQEEVTVPSGPEGAEPALVLPKLGTSPQRAYVQVLLLLPDGGSEAVKVDRLTLKPSPVELTARPATGARGFSKPEEVNLYLSAINNTPGALEPIAHLKVLNSQGQAICYEPRQIVIGGRCAAHFPFKPKLKENGSYELLVRVIAGGQEIGMIRYPFQVGPPPEPPSPALEPSAPAPLPEPPPPVLEPATPAPSAEAVAPPEPPAVEPAVPAPSPDPEPPAAEPAIPAPSPAGSGS